MSNEFRIILKEIVPKIMYYQNKIHDITFVDPALIIKGYKIGIEDSKIRSLILSNRHPNCNPNTKEFCLPPNVIGANVDDVKDLLSYLLTVYNMESCYFSPWGLIRYTTR